MARHGYVVVGTAAAAILGVAFFLGAPAAAAPPAEGDWIVNGTESYVDQNFTLAWASDNSSFGNLSVTENGTLLFDNVTIYLPVFATFDIQGRVEVRNSTLFGAGYRIRVNGTTVFEDNTIYNATFGGTIIETMNASFVRNEWDCGGSSSGTIHIRVPLDFRHNTMRMECLVSYELPVLETNEDIEFAWNLFWDNSSGTQLTFNSALHNGTVHINIHNVSVYGGGWSILINAAAPNTTYDIHDCYFWNTSLATIRVDAFEGGLHLWNLRFDSIYRAARINGVPGRPVVATIDNITVNGSTDSIYAEDATWIVRNVTHGGSFPQFDAGPNGHILIYDSAVTAHASTASGVNGTVEHFVYLNVVGLTWQNDVPIIGDVVTFRNATGRNFLNVTPSTWSPQLIVWWGVYNTGGRVDNRDLRPVIVEGPRTFGCTPSQFFVQVPMPPITIVCTDDLGPTVTVTGPTVPSYLRTPSLTVQGSVFEAGSGFVSAGWGMDNATFTDLGSTGAESFNWSLASNNLADGSYTFYFRTTDRVGNVAYFSHGPINIDTVTPTISLGATPTLINRTTYDLGGSTEAFATMTVRFSSGWNRTAPVGATGTFAFAVPVIDGQNTYTISVVDRAGNSVQQSYFLTVDRAAPSLSVLLNSRPERDIFTASATAHVSGSCEAGAVVQVNALDVARPGSAFEQTVLLDAGPNHLTVTCTDAAGNQASWFADAFHDNVPPTVTAALEGTAPLPGGTYVLRSDVAPLVATSADLESGLAALSVNGIMYAVSGDGTVRVSLALEEGTNLLRAVAVDHAGNFATATIEVRRDTTRPRITAQWEEVDSPLNVVDGSYSTRGDRANLRLNLSEAAAVQLSGALNNLPAGESVLQISLTEGQNRVDIDLNDTAGNPGFSLVLAIMRDSADPAVTIVSPAANAHVTDPVARVTGTAEPGSTVWVQGNPVSVSTSGEFVAFVPLVEGPNTISVEAEDAVGNTANQTVTITHAPAAVAPTTGVSGGLEIPSLVVGLGIGAGIGAVALKPRRGAAAGAPRDVRRSRVEEASDEPQAPAPAPRPKGPQAGPQKGPRGPQPPQ